MTLDEAITHAEEVAEEQEKVAKEWHENQVRKCELFRFAEMDYTHENDCKKCAVEHRQLAEWLRDYKRLKEQQPCEDAVSRQGLLDAFGLSEKTRKYGGDHSGYDTMMLYEIQNVIESAESVNPQEPKTDTWSIKDVADTLAKHGLIVEQEPRWIPVSKKLPDNNDDVLVYDYSDIFVAWYSGIDRNWCSADNRFDEYTPIIAWQPLPEPYEPQESDNCN